MNMQSELKTLNVLPFDTNLLFKCKEIEKILNEYKFYESYLRSHSTNLLYNIKIILLKNPKKDNCILRGSELYTKFNKGTSPNINIVFSNTLNFSGVMLY